MYYRLTYLLTQTMFYVLELLQLAPTGMLRMSVYSVSRRVPASCLPSCNLGP